MSWRDQLQDCSVAGVKCHWRSLDGELGRRVAVHKYPLRDGHYPEDMGGSGDTISGEFYVLGPDYMVARDALQNALNKQGPCEFVHPTRGRMQVQVGLGRLSESTSEGGFARFSVTIYATSAAKFPSETSDSGADVSDKADAASKAGATWFDGIFSVADMPGWVADEATAVLGSATDAIDGAMAFVPGLSTAGSEFSAAVNGFRNSINTLILSPYLLAQTLHGMFGVIETAVSDPVPALSQYESLGAFGNDAVVPAATTPARQQQSDNQIAIGSLVRTSAAISMARTAAGMTPESSSAAIDLMRSITGILQEEAEASNDIDLYLALMDLSSAVVADMTVRAANLPSVRTFTPRVTMPALLIAHRLYGDATRADELVARNAIEHPGFVPGGSPLEYLDA